MKVLVVGGGSGGHITPAIAVVREILKKNPRTRIEFWTDGKYYRNVTKIMALGKDSGGLNVRVRRIFSGKFRRYAGWKLVDYFKNIKITVVDLILKNFLGFFGFIAGLGQSLIRLVPKKSRPDVIFLKGGFVGLPVGLAARTLKIPYVIHESDATPGLANRILMKQAAKVAMGVKYAESVTEDDGTQRPIKGRENWEWVGIPIGGEFRKVPAGRAVTLKKAFGFSASKPLVVITGGSQGSEHLNMATAKILPRLMKTASVALIAGRKNYEKMIELKKYEVWEDAKLESNFRMWEFNSAMHELLGAADVVVSRAGATTIAELAALAKATILVPFEKLPGAHQVKNAERLQKLGAAEMILDGEMEKNPAKLLGKIEGLVKNTRKREVLAENLHKEAKADAAKRLAEIILETGGR